MVSDITNKLEEKHKRYPS